ncbi:MAG TPA: two-component regulator propeller domain-containing protein, partial [Flavobacteriales bacterium]|nr:two-component regulator propeller domain-containing protein [Flavobacteriales bacterium]
MRSRALLLLLIAALTARAQVASERRYSLRHWSIADGISHRSINSIVKDRSGYLWLGTDGGLDRFDGYSFEPYGTAQGIRSEKVHTLLLDAQGRIWVCGNDPDGSIAAIDVLDPLQAKARPLEGAVPAFAGIDAGEFVGP